MNEGLGPVGEHKNDCSSSPPSNICVASRKIIINCNLDDAKHFSSAICRFLKSGGRIWNSRTMQKQSSSKVKVDLDPVEEESRLRDNIW
jgi:hypothetical protein